MSDRATTPANVPEKAPANAPENAPAPACARGRASVDLDAILTELGSFGRYQIRTYCFILLPIVFAAIYSSQYIFAAGITDHRCLVPECERAPGEWVPGEWGTWALPEGGGSCSRMEPLEAHCAPESFHLNRTVSCDAWVYENNNTVVSTFGLACQEWKRTLIGTVHSAGQLVALPLIGYASDTFGRRMVFVLTALCAALCGIIRAFSPNYIMFLVFEFLDAMLGSGVYSTGFILALEWVETHQRVLGGNIISISWALGQAMLAVVAWALPQWRTLTVVLYAPSLLFVFYFYTIEESVRWLLSKGNKKKAARILFKATETNKRKLSPESMRQLTEDNTTSAKLEQKMDKKDPGRQPIAPGPSLFMEVVRSRIIMCRMGICSFWWMTTTFVYYGLSINSVSLGGNMYVNYILTVLVEIPGYVMSFFTLDRFGRKSAIMSAFIICGLALLAFPFIPSSVTWAITFLNMLGKLSISMAFSSIYIYTSELFPTTARHQLLAFCSMVGRIGSIVAPQTPLLMLIWESLPYLIFGVMAMMSALLMTLTPETLNQPLPDTVAEAEMMSRKPRSQGS